MKAILEGRKTQTRRVIKPIPDHFHDFNDGVGFRPQIGDKDIKCPYGQPGDRLWVRETWKLASFWEGEPPDYQYKADGAVIEENRIYGENAPNYDEWWERICYRAYDDLKRINCPQDEDGNFHWDRDASPLPWRPSIFMPRWASRITLEVVNIRVERLQEITIAECIAEGVKDSTNLPHIGGSGIEKTEFYLLWNSINAKRGYSWESNPWVWIIEFKSVEP